jgi:hypothetical protein
MSFIVKASEGSSFKPVPPGTHLARCYRIVDLGTQETNYQGKINHQRKMMIQWEVHGADEDGNEMVTRDGEPMTISKNYTVSLGEKARLRQDLITWRGKAFTPEELKGFELKNLLGVWCMLGVIETQGNDGKTYSNVNAITPVPAVVKKNGLPPYHNAVGIFSLENPDMELFESFSDHLKGKIQGSPEWASRGRSATPVLSNNVQDDDIPF